MAPRHAVTAAMLVAVVLVIGTAGRPYAAQSEKNTLPKAGTVAAELPAGDAATMVRSRCVVCHAADMLLQQRLTERQWAAEINKMQQWGSPVRDEEKAMILKYLVGVAGPENTRFNPRPVAPVKAE